MGDQRHRKIFSTGSLFTHKVLEADAPQELEKWCSQLQPVWNADGYTITEKGDNFSVGHRDTEEELPRTLGHTTHRSGTVYENESEEMREACVDTIETLLNTDVILHEVRHQRNGYHTDLVYADIDSEKLAERKTLTNTPEPIHEPYERFRIWWSLYFYGPKSETDAIDNGVYKNASKNRKHVSWLKDHGYIAETVTGHLVGVSPPSFCTLHAVELKRRDWETALEQAARARVCESNEIYEDAMGSDYTDKYGYADYAWVALDAGAITNALENKDAFEDTGVGLLAISENGTVTKHVDAAHQPRGEYTRDRAYIESQVWEQSVDEIQHVQKQGNTQPDLTSF